LFVDRFTTRDSQNTSTQTTPREFWCMTRLILSAISGKIQNDSPTLRTTQRHQALIQNPSRKIVS